MSPTTLTHGQETAENNFLHRRAPLTLIETARSFFFQSALSTAKNRLKHSNQITELDTGLWGLAQPSNVAPTNLKSTRFMKL